MDHSRGDSNSPISWKGGTAAPLTEGDNEVGKVAQDHTCPWVGTTLETWQPRLPVPHGQLPWGRRPWTGALTGNPTPQPCLVPALSPGRGSPWDVIAHPSPPPRPHLSAPHVPRTHGSHVPHPTPLESRNWPLVDAHGQWMLGREVLDASRTVVWP